MRLSSRAREIITSQTSFSIEMIGKTDGCVTIDRFNQLKCMPSIGDLIDHIDRYDICDRCNLSLLWF